MTIRIPEGHVARIEAHAAATYPEECIGALGGTADGDSRSIVEVWPLVNACIESRHSRSLIAPRDYQAVEREYTRRGLLLLGFYHSHPDHPAAPSSFDLEHALPWHSYLIVRVDRGHPTEMTAWVLREDRSTFDPEPMAVVQDGRAPTARGGDR